MRAAGFFGEIGLSGAKSESELDALPRGVCAESLPASADRAGPARSHKPPDAKRGEGSPAARGHELGATPEARLRHRHRDLRVLPRGAEEPAHQLGPAADQ